MTDSIFSIDDFLKICYKDQNLRDLALDEHSLDFLQKVGLDLEVKNHQVYLASKVRSWKEQKFCFVDIEVTDSDPLKGRLLEIGGIICNGEGEVLGHFERLVKNIKIPQMIQKITGITPEEMEHAQDVQKVLFEFREFLGTCVFVAHHVEFDYGFLNYLFYKYFGLGIYNQTLCTLKMAKQLIQAPSYKLSVLNQFLQIFSPISHRAYADAYVCKEVFMHCTKEFDDNMSTQELLNQFGEHKRELKK